MTAELPPAPLSPGLIAQLRASHADRDLAVDILCAAAGDGRISVAELDERLDAALTARTVSELAALTADLPGGTMLQAACQTWASKTMADTGQPAAGRWALLQSLVSKPRLYELFTG